MNNINIIFDFDGTIVDSLHAIVKQFNLLADELHLKKIEQHEMNHLRDLTSRELVQYLKIPLYKLPSVINKARKYMYDEMHILSPFPNVRRVIEQLHQSNVMIGILTSNSKKNVTEWLRTHDMQHLFHFIHEESSYFYKTLTLRKMIKLYQLDKANTFYIGDETRDVVAAKKCQIFSIAVTWGFNSEKVLSQYEPHFIARKPTDILDICMSSK